MKSCKNRRSLQFAGSRHGDPGESPPDHASGQIPRHNARNGSSAHAARSGLPIPSSSQVPTRLPRYRVSVTAKGHFCQRVLLAWAHVFARITCAESQPAILGGEDCKKPGTRLAKPCEATDARMACTHPLGVRNQVHQSCCSEAVPRRGERVSGSIDHDPNYVWSPYHSSKNRLVPICQQVSVDLPATLVG